MKKFLLHGNEKAQDESMALVTEHFWGAGISVCSEHFFLNVHLVKSGFFLLLFKPVMINMF